jgi:hypothetical protein
MTEVNAAPADAPAVPKAKKESRPKPRAVNLVSGAGQILRFSGVQRKSGKFTCKGQLITKGADGKKERVPGASSQHDDLAAAQAYIDKAATAAEKLGWKRKSGGFTAKPDAFSLESLPKPKAK